MKIRKQNNVPALPAAFDLDAAFIRCGKVALRVLYEPRTSISITALKAFELSCVIGARKLPAAPALCMQSARGFPSPSCHCYGSKMATLTSQNLFLPVLVHISPRLGSNFQASARL